MGRDPEAQARVLRALALLPEDKKLAMLATLAELAGDQVTRGAAYLDDPEKFSREVLDGLPWSRTQRRLSEDFFAKLYSPRPGKILCLGGNGTGKSHGLYDNVIAAWYFEWIRWKLRERAGDTTAPGGVELIVSAPSRENLEDTAYYGLIERGKAAAKNGHPLPGWLPRRRGGRPYGGASESTVLWHDKPWRMSAKAPKARASGDMAHAAGGTHGKGIQILLIEEMSGVEAGMIEALSGMGVAGNVTQVAATNPTSVGTPLHAIVTANRAAWTLFSFSQLDHPNVLRRDPDLVPGAVSHYNLEEALRSAAFEDRGPWPGTDLDKHHLDVIYALPPLDMAEEPGPRADGYSGHPKAELRVYRPATALVAGKHLGAWLESDGGSSLFQISTIMQRMVSGTWRLPDGEPDRVGFDCAPTRNPVACPSWGPSARMAIDASAVQGAIVCGKPVDIRWNGDDSLEKDRCAAEDMVARFGTSPKYIGDDAAGAGVATVLRELGCTSVELVLFGSAPVGKGSEVHGMPANRRVELHVDAAESINAGLVSLPYSEVLLAQMRLTGSLIDSGSRTGAKGLRPKKDIERELGKSPDQLDVACLALAGVKRAVHW